MVRGKRKTLTKEGKRHEEAKGSIGILTEGSPQNQSGDRGLEMGWQEEELALRAKKYLT